MKKIILLGAILFGFIMLSENAYSYEGSSVEFTVEQPDTVISGGVTLYPCYPNPVKTGTIKIKFLLENESAVKIKIYDAEGNETKSVVNDVVYSDGTPHEVPVNIDDLFVGTYNVAIIVRGKLISQQFVVMK